MKINVRSMKRPRRNAVILGNRLNGMFNLKMAVAQSMGKIKVVF